MALFDFLKKKEEAEKSKKTAGKSQPKTEKKDLPEKAEKALVAEKPEAKKEVSATKTVKSKKGSFSFETVKRPHISEKASYLGERNQYVFEVSSDSNKNEIRNTVEGIYGVNVLSVNVVKIPPKKRRLGKSEGFRKGYKKAIVRIKEGQKIEIL